MYEHWARGDFPASFLDPAVEHSRIGADTRTWRVNGGVSKPCGGGHDVVKAGANDRVSSSCEAVKR